MVDRPVDKANSPARKMTDTPASAVLAIFCKAPVAGEVKTRLCPPLTLDQAAELYAVALDETLRRCADLACDLVICYSGDQSYFAQNYPLIQRRPQRGEDLGARLGEALHALLLQGYGRVILMGSDSPDLPLKLVDQALAALGSVDVVVAPATDGGYVLLGARRYHAALFGAMPWSSPTLMAQTRAVLTAGNIPWQQLKGWQDMDEEADLRELLKRSPASQTARYVRQLGLIRF
jgi:rSAM/selenodomain-associated transferase 1